ncbi:cytochrome B [Methylotenera oryzisoli]|jgi:cytochrome b561|uniref:Cytochrome B n=1 Tax=Methylotenera oryzisoli TaxID=2080758 RepID=A0A4Y9VTG9_9PROT|nr:cytochrome b [Methylotenera oryzisoli]TFW72318.1 cytochrome B [Methylotenera oryzisoli]
MNQDSSRYTKPAVILHWLIALVVIAMFALGWYMTELPKEAAKQTAFDLFDLGVYTWHLAEEVSPRNFYFNLHKSIGVTLLALIGLRVLWRITHRPPAMLASYKAWEKKLATGTHHLLYLLMVAMPVSGLIMAMSGKYGVKWFGIDIIAGLDNSTLRDIFKEAHEIIGAIFLIAIILHILGALKHKWIDKDGTMKRMSF